MPIEIITANFNDWAALLRLLRGAFAYMEARIDPPSSLNTMTEDDLRRKAGRERLIVAMQEHELVGCAYADVRTDRVRCVST